MKQLLAILIIVLLFAGCKTQKSIESNTSRELYETMQPYPVKINGDSVTANFTLKTDSRGDIVPTQVSVKGATIDMLIAVAANGNISVKATQPDRIDTLMAPHTRELITTSETKVVTKTKASAITRWLSRIGIISLLAVVLYITYRIFRAKLKII